MRLFTTRLLVALAASALIAASCSGKKSSEQTAPGGRAAETESSRTAAGDLAWEVPDGWTQQAPSNSMRLAQFSVPHAESDSLDGSVVVTFFPGQGEVGGVQRNLDRWFTQFEQPDGKASSEVAKVRERTVAGMKVTQVSLTGTFIDRPMMMSSSTVTRRPGFAMRAAIIEGPHGPYFVKFLGPEATVSKWADSFNRFIESFHRT